MVILPSWSTYWVATCPLAMSLWSHASLATKRPSPWDAGLQYTPPSPAPASHGDLLDTTLVYAILETWRPMVFMARVGESGPCSTILPSGTSPSLIRAWKPLQMPSISPSRSFNSFSSSSFITALRNTVAKNLAEPSGSSPAENPPGNITIWAPAMAFLYSSTDCRISSAPRFLNTFVTTFAPARSNAFVLSYSQLVPGNTGMNTVGCPSLWSHIYTAGLR